MSGSNSDSDSEPIMKLNSNLDSVSASTKPLAEFESTSASTDSPPTSRSADSDSLASVSSSLRCSSSHLFHSSSFPSTSFSHSLILYLRSLPRFFAFLYSNLSILLRAPSLPPPSSSSPFSSLFTSSVILFFSCLVFLTYVCLPLLFLRTKEAWMSLCLIAFAISFGHFIWFEREKEDRNRRIGVSRLVSRRRPPQKTEWLKLLPIVMLGSFTLFLMTSHTTDPILAYRHSTWMKMIAALSQWFPLIASTLGPPLFALWIDFLLLPVNVLSLSIYSLLFQHNFDTSHSLLEYFPFLTSIPYLSSFVSDSRPSSPALSPSRSLSDSSSPRIVDASGLQLPSPSRASTLGPASRLSYPAVIRRDAKLMSMRSAISNSLVGGGGGSGTSVDEGMNQERAKENEKREDWRGDREDEPNQKREVGKESGLSKAKFDFISDKTQRVLGFAGQFESNTGIREGIRRRNSVDCPSLSFGTNKSKNASDRSMSPGWNREFIGRVKPQPPTDGNPLGGTMRIGSRPGLKTTGVLNKNGNENEIGNVDNDESASKINPRDEYRSVSQLSSATGKDGLDEAEMEKENEMSSREGEQHEQESQPLSFRSPSPRSDAEPVSRRREIAVAVASRRGHGSALVRTCALNDEGSGRGGVGRLEENWNCPPGSNNREGLVTVVHSHNTV